MTVCFTIGLRDIIAAYGFGGEELAASFRARAWLRVRAWLRWSWMNSSAAKSAHITADAESQSLHRILRALARGEDVWREFLDLFGPFILHILKHDYALYDDYDDHSRQEVLHDIYLRVAKYAGRMGRSTTLATYRGYLRRIIRTVMSNNGRILRRWKREVSIDHVNESGFQMAADPALNPLKWLETQWRARSIIPAAKKAIRMAASRSRDPLKTTRILERRLLAEAPYSEIADEVAMEVDAVRHVVHYYRHLVIQRVRSQLAVQGPKEEVVAQGGDER
ncbi:MAG: hypothetical protein B1H03_05750 [Planctomycetales bacterium 4484_113]|nr:MAG: hypothetical protein B1H03_05750 [Planctomycetales bacterium 4484_113]